MEEELLWRHLGALGINEADEAHPTFGNTKVNQQP
jgi:hypothetical protein